MKEKKWNRTGMRITNFESKHKTFNRYIDCPSKGNVIGRGQLSFYVRAHSEVECNGFVNPPGHLRAFDLKYFHLSSGAGAWLDKNREREVILYEFYHYVEEKRFLHGHVVQDVKHPSKFMLFKNPNASWKSQTVLEEAVKFLN